MVEGTLVHLPFSDMGIYHGSPVRVSTGSVGEGGNLNYEQRPEGRTENQEKFPQKSLRENTKKDTTQRSLLYLSGSSLRTSRSGHPNRSQEYTTEWIRNTTC